MRDIVYTCDICKKTIDNRKCFIVSVSKPCGFNISFDDVLGERHFCSEFHISEWFRLVSENKKESK